MTASPSAAHRDPLNPFPWYAQMRAHAPVLLDPERQLWNVFRYAEVQRVLSEYAVFSSRFGEVTGADASALSNSLVATDPPRHRQLRALVSQAFTPRGVDDLAPRIEQITNELLDAVQDRGRMDFVHDFTYPLPVIVIAEMLGVPASDRDQFKAWSDAITSATPEGAAAQQAMTGYFVSLIEERRRAPRKDLVSALMAAQIDGEHLSMPELLGFCVLLLVAGNETTTNLIGNALLCLDEWPDVCSELRADVALLPGFIEEVLRYRSPVQSMFRVVAQRTEVGDQVLEPDQSVLAWIGSANRDAAAFEDPDRFDPRRVQNKHLAFGRGIHFCLGAPLARLEAQIALRAVLTRFPTIRLAPEAHLEAQDSFIVYGVKSLPVTFR
jgi:cytochrome P450